MMTPQEILSEWEQDAKIDPVEIDQSSIDIAKLHSKYLNYYYTISNTLRKWEQSLSKLKHDKTRYYSGQLTKAELDEKKWDYDPFKGAKKPLKSEIGKWVDVDEDVKAQISIVEEMKLTKEVIKEILEHIKWRPQNIKNVIEYRKFVAGE